MQTVQLGFASLGTSKHRDPFQEEGVHDSEKTSRPVEGLKALPSERKAASENTGCKQLILTK